MRYELKSVSAWSYIKVMFFVNLIVGFVLGIFYGFFSGVFISIAAEFMIFPEEVFDMQSGFPIAIYVIAIAIMFSFGNAVFGTIFGAVIIGFYNLIVRLTGGLEFVLKPTANIATDGPIAAPSDAQASLESATSQPVKAKYIIPPPPPPISGTAEPAKAKTPPLAESTSTSDKPPELPASPNVPNPPPAPNEEEKNDEDKFKPPDYFKND